MIVVKGVVTQWNDIALYALHYIDIPLSILKTCFYGMTFDMANILFTKMDLMYIMCIIELSLSKVWGGHLANPCHINT